MTDERPVLAGDLTSDALGKRVRVTAESGVVIEDELLDIRHFIDLPASILVTAADAPKPRVWVRFRNCAPGEMSFDRGFILSQYSMAHVVSSPVSGEADRG